MQGLQYLSKTDKIGQPRHSLDIGYQFSIDAGALGQLTARHTLDCAFVPNHLRQC
jgi:hypothetical protein